MKLGMKKSCRKGENECILTASLAITAASQLLKVDRTQFLEGVEVLAGMTKRNRMAKAPAVFL
jgi:hypothetical protein